MSMKKEIHVIMTEKECEDKRSMLNMANETILDLRDEIDSLLVIIKCHDYDPDELGRIYLRLRNKASMLNDILRCMSSAKEA